MEGQEGNEIVYDLLLDQAWSTTPIDTATYFHNWVSTRYSTGTNSIPASIYTAWDILRTSVYNNTNLAGNAVVKSIFELAPSTSGLVNRTGHHPTLVPFNPASVVQAWNLFANATTTQPSLWSNTAFLYDFVDITRQVFADAFIPYYQTLISAYESGNATTAAITAAGSNVTSLLSTLDSILLTNQHFLLSNWISSAISWADKPPSEASSSNTTLTAAYLEYNARNQITLWGPTGQISDYASKQWGGLVGNYYLPRWQMFVNYLVSTPYASYNATVWGAQLLAFEEAWQTERWGAVEGQTLGTVGSLKGTLKKAVQQWPSVFGRSALKVAAQWVD